MPSPSTSPKDHPAPRPTTTATAPAAWTIGDLLGVGVDSSVALAAPERPPATYADLRRHVARTVEELRAEGIGRNDRVALVLPGGAEAAAGFLSVASAAAAAPLNPACTRSEFLFFLEDLGAAAVLLMEGDPSPAREAADSLGVRVLEIRAREDRPAGMFRLLGTSAGRTEGSDGKGRRLRGMAPPTGPPGSWPRPGGLAPADMPQPDDAALLLHTSGTTSQPKLVPLLHRNVSASARHVRDSLRLGPVDRCLNVMPLFHVHGLVACLLASLAAGGSVFCAPGFDALRFFRWMDAWVPTWYSAVPSMHQAILARAPRNRRTVARARLRFVRSSSAPLPAAVARELEETFSAPVVESYAMTEAAHQMTSTPLPPGRRKPGSVGPAAGPELSVVDERGTHLGPGETGEIVVRGPNVAPGYEGGDANQAAFAGGWFRTGDQGFRDEDGWLTVTGRIKEIINRGGEKVSPREVDDVLAEHPAVLEAATFGLPHAKLGEEVAAAVVLRERERVAPGDGGARRTEGSAASGGRASVAPGPQAPGVGDEAVSSIRAFASELSAQSSSSFPTSIRAFAGERLAAFKVPRILVVVDELPKGPTGKVRRDALAERLGLVPARGTDGGRVAHRDGAPATRGGPPHGPARSG